MLATAETVACRSAKPAMRVSDQAGERRPAQRQHSCPAPRLRHAAKSFRDEQSQADGRPRARRGDDVREGARTVEERVGQVADGISKALRRQDHARHGRLHDDRGRDDDGTRGCWPGQRAARDSSGFPIDGVAQEGAAGNRRRDQFGVAGRPMEKDLTGGGSDRARRGDEQESAFGVNPSSEQRRQYSRDRCRAGLTRADQAGQAAGGADQSANGC